MAEDDPRIRACTQLIWTYVVLFVAGRLIWAFAYLPVVWQRFVDPELIVPIGFLVLYRMILRKQRRGRFWTFYTLAVWQAIYTTDHAASGAWNVSYDYFVNMNGLSIFIFKISAWLLLISAVVIVRMSIFPLRRPLHTLVNG